MQGNFNILILAQVHDSCIFPTEIIGSIKISLSVILYEMKTRAKA